SLERPGRRVTGPGHPPQSGHARAPELAISRRSDLGLLRREAGFKIGACGAQRAHARDVRTQRTNWSHTSELAMKAADESRDQTTMFGAATTPARHRDPGGDLGRVDGKRG